MKEEEAVGSTKSIGKSKEVELYRGEESGGATSSMEVEGTVEESILGESSSKTR